MYQKDDVVILTTNQEMIYYDGLDRAIERQTGIKPEIIAFASRHSSKQKLPALTTHVTGNWEEPFTAGRMKALQ